MMRLRRLSLALPLVFALSCGNHGSADTEVKEALRELDRVIQAEEIITASKESHCSALRDKLGQADNPYVRYQILNSLYEEYAKSRLDSALVYVHLKEDLAREIGDRTLINDAALDKAERYLISGMYRYAQEALESIVVDDHLTRQRLCDFYRAYTVLYHGLKLTNKDPLFNDRLDSLEHHYRDLYFSSADTTMLYYHTYSAEYEIDKGNPEKGREKLEHSIRTRQNSIDDLAILHYCIAKTYRLEGDMDKALVHYAISARHDLSHGVRASRSLIQTARMVMARGQIRKAFSYITRAHQDAILSDARICLTELSAFMPGVMSSYEQVNRRRFQDIYLIIFLMALLLALAVAGLYFARRYQKRLLKYDKTIKSINDDLQQHILEVKKANELRENTLGQYVAMFTDHINSLEEYRSSIRVIAKSKDLDEITHALRSDEFIDARREALLQEFDRVFLGVFPDFVAQLNALLQEESRIGRNLPEGRLNNEIRIFALIRLGVKESADIARFLKKSPSTIYNYRVKLRKASLCPNEEFESRLMEIGEA